MYTKKDIEISSFLRVTSPADFRLRGTRPPSPPPLSTPMGLSFTFIVGVVVLAIGVAVFKAEVVAS